MIKNDFADLETELRALLPRQPGGNMELRLARAFAAAEAVETPSSLVTVGWWHKLGFDRPLAAFSWGLATPAAAVCAVVLLHLSAGTTPAVRRPAFPVNPVVAAISAPPAAAVQSEFEPAAASDVVYQTSDEGVVFNSKQKPARQMRYRSRETLAWRNPRTGAQVEVSYPREEVVLTPVALR